VQIEVHEAASFLFLEQLTILCITCKMTGLSMLLHMILIVQSFSVVDTVALRSFVY